MSDFVLKIRWTRHETREPEKPTSYVNADIDVEPDMVTTRIVSLEDETTLFIPADEIRVHASIPAGQRSQVMKHWHESDGSHVAPGYLNYLSVTDNGDVGGEEPGRLICVVKDGVESWYTATHAWILGPDGGTIERVAP